MATSACMTPTAPQVVQGKITRQAKLPTPPPIHASGACHSALAPLVLPTPSKRSMGHLRSLAITQARCCIVIQAQCTEHVLQTARRAHRQ